MAIIIIIFVANTLEYKGKEKLKIFKTKKNWLNDAAHEYINGIILSSSN